MIVASHLLLRTHPQRHQGGKHPAGAGRVGDDRGLRRIRVARDRQRPGARLGTTHVRRDAMLDGAGGHGAGGPRAFTFFN